MKSSLREKINLRTAFQILIFVVGLLIFIYPMISRYYYRVESTKVVEDFSVGKKALSDETINKRIALANAYNASLSGMHDFKDPYVNNIEEGIKNYAHMLEVREKIGVVRIPKIDVNLPIFAGTGEDVLQNGVGHMEYTSLPVGGESTHSVLTAHRGLPNAKLFSDLNLIQEGDLFYVENLKETLAYEVDQIKVIEPSVFDDLLIVPNEDLCTLLTCTPYMINSHRLLVRGHRVPYNEEDLNKELQKAKLIKVIKFIIIAFGIIIVLILFMILLKRIRRKSKRRKLWKRKKYFS